MRLEQLLDVPLEANAAAGEQHDVVADALDVGDDVRGDDAPLPTSLRRRPSGAEAARGRRADRGSQTARRGGRAVAACPARARGRAGRARPTERAPTFVARVDARQQARPTISRSQREFVRRANSIVSATRERTVERCSLRDVADLAENRPGLRAGRRREPRSSRRSARACPPRARGASTSRPRSAPPARRSPPSGSQRQVAQSPVAAEALAQTLCDERRGAHATRRARYSRSVVEMSARMLSSSSPAHGAPTRASARAPRAARRDAAATPERACWRRRCRVPAARRPDPRARGRDTPSRPCSG